MPFGRKKSPEVASHTYEEWASLTVNQQIPGQPGEMEYSPDGAQVRCHLCGSYFKEITNTHLGKHGLFDTNDYRDLLGLNRTFGLTSPENREKRSERAIRENSVRNIEALRTPFGPDNPRPPQEPRLQRRLSISRLMLSRRSKNEPPPTAPELKVRRTHRGAIKVYSHLYFVSNTVSEVAIEITDEEIIARGVDKKGNAVEKRFTRKDDH